MRCKFWACLKCSSQLFSGMNWLLTVTSLNEYLLPAEYLHAMSVSWPRLGITQALLLWNDSCCKDQMLYCLCLEQPYFLDYIILVFIFPGYLILWVQSSLSSYKDICQEPSVWCSFCSLCVMIFKISTDQRMNVIGYSTLTLRCGCQCCREVNVGRLKFSKEY